MRKKTQYIVVNEIYKTIYCGYPQKRAWNVFETERQRNPNQTNMYTDLMSEFVSNGHEVTVLSLMEARNQRNTFYAEENGMCVLRVKCGNIQKTGKYKKVISSLVANFRIINAVRKYFTEKQFDLMIFALPPSTIAPSVCLLKRRFRARLYLLLKEFWPQDPTDLKAMREGGVVWKFFDHLSKMLYNSSDYIGTMSEAGIGFLKKVTPMVNKDFSGIANHPVAFAGGMWWILYILR